MIVENSPSARYQLRTRGELVAPSSCITCGSGTRDEGYLDLNVFIEFHGTVYVCVVCLTDLAEIAGMFTPEEVGHLQSQIESLLAQNEQLTSELSNVTEHRDSLESTLRLSFGAVGVSSGITDAVVEESADKPENHEGTTGGSAGGESEPEEPIKISKSRAPSKSKLRNTTFE